MKQEGPELVSILTAEDIAGVYTSSTDGYFDPRLVVSSNGYAPYVSSTLMQLVFKIQACVYMFEYDRRNIWVPTGLLPQCMTIELGEKWFIRKVIITLLCYNL